MDDTLRMRSGVKRYPKPLGRGTILGGRGMEAPLPALLWARYCTHPGRCMAVSEIGHFLKPKLGETQPECAAQSRLPIGRGKRR